MKAPVTSIPATQDVSAYLALGDGYVLQRIRIRASRTAIGHRGAEVNGCQTLYRAVEVGEGVTRPICAKIDARAVFLPVESI